MRTEEQLAKAYIDARLSGHPKSLYQLILGDLIADLLKELEPEIQALIDKLMADRERRQ